MKNLGLILGLGGMLVAMSGCVCIGVAYMDFQEDDGIPRGEWGELVCSGRCWDGSQCVVQSRDIEDPTGRILRREWCGCEDRPEPKRCHAVRKLVQGDNGNTWDVESEGECFWPWTFCWKDHITVQPHPGFDARIRADCRCRARPPHWPEGGWTFN